MTTDQTECRKAFEDAMEAEYGIRPTVQSKREYGSFQAYWYGWQACWNTRSPAPDDGALVENALRRAAEILTNFTSNEPTSNATELDRLKRKLEEWEACYALLFKQMNQLSEMLRQQRQHQPAQPSAEVVKLLEKAQYFTGFYLSHTTESMLIEAHNLIKAAIAALQSAPQPVKLADENINDSLEAEPCEVSLEQLIAWYNSPNAVTANRFQYFYALCRHVKWMELKRAHTPEQESPPSREVPEAEAVEVMLAANNGFWCMKSKLETAYRALKEHLKKKGMGL